MHTARAHSVAEPRYISGRLWLGIKRNLAPRHTYLTLDSSVEERMADRIIEPCESETMLSPIMEQEVCFHSFFHNFRIIIKFFSLLSSFTYGEAGSANIGSKPLIQTSESCQTCTLIHVALQHLGTICAIPTFTARA